MAISHIIETLYVGDYEDARTAPPDMTIICVLENDRGREGAIWIPILSATGKADHGQLDNVAQTIDSEMRRGRDVLVNCGAAIERSPLAVAWFLHTRRQMSLDEAYNLIISKRPQAQRRDTWLLP